MPGDPLHTDISGVWEAPQVPNPLFLLTSVNTFHNPLTEIQGITVLPAPPKIPTFPPQTLIFRASDQNSTPKPQLLERYLLIKEA